MVLFSVLSLIDKSSKLFTEKSKILIQFFENYIVQKIQTNGKIGTFIALGVISYRYDFQGSQVLPRNKQNLYRIFDLPNVFANEE